MVLTHVTTTNSLTHRRVCYPPLARPGLLNSCPLLFFYQASQAFFDLVIETQQHHHHFASNLLRVSSRPAHTFTICIIFDSTSHAPMLCICLYSGISSIRYARLPANTPRRDNMPVDEVGVLFALMFPYPHLLGLILLARFFSFFHDDDELLCFFDAHHADTFLTLSFF